MSISNKLKEIRMKRSFNRAHQPTVSVIIPTYNQKDLLELVLVALFNQDYPRDKYEIIVADDGSSDGTKELIAKISKKSPIPLKYCFQEDKGFRAGQARNLGASNANGEVLVFLDGDIIADRDLINQHVKSQIKHDLVSGYAAGHRNEKQFNLSLIKTWILKGDYSLKNIADIPEGRDFYFSHHVNKYSKYNKYLWEFFHSNNFSIKKGIFDEFKFDERFVGWGEEDIEFAYRLFKGGKDLFFNKKCYAIHYEERTEDMMLNYTSKKLESQINNMHLFYKIYQNEDIHRYVVRRFASFPDKLLTNKRKFFDILDIDKGANKRILGGEFKAGSVFLRSYPLRVYVELTKNCNMRCKMCRLSGQQTKNSDLNNMDFIFFKRVAYEFFPYADFVDLRGLGESLLYPKIKDVFEFCFRFDCDFGLVTNLSVRDLGLLRLMMERNLWLGVSIDGPTEEVYGQIRGEGHFKQVIRNLQYISKNAWKYDYDLSRLYLLVTVQRDNFNSLPYFVVLAKSLGVKRVEFNPVVSKDSTINLSCVEKEAKKKIEDAAALSKKEGISLVLTGVFFEKGYVKEIITKYGLSSEIKDSYLSREAYMPYRGCPCGYSHLFIAHSGKIGPCNHLMNLLLLGDMSYKLETQRFEYHPSFRDEWNNDCFVSFRKKLNSKDKLAFCLRCTERQYPFNYS